MRAVKALPLVLAFLAAGCTSAPNRAPEAPTRSILASAEMADDAATHALKMVGRPYKYGGSTPAGFDCSGLIRYSFGRAGLSLPHGTDKLRGVSNVVKTSELRRGDLLFFHQEGKRYGHAGIYLGNGRFVHAPSSGKSVRTDGLDAPYWKRHLSEVRRL
ncbi:MAG TPA: C40 family peptidase [Burkholderiales bacterium]|nr:C40 family peptidase [Burkholderiales bacterium]